MKAEGRSLEIFGAGLAGSLLATLLAREGWRVTLFEKRSDLRQGTLAGGRSINLAISVRGLTALAAIGLKEAALRLAVAMPGRFIHHLDGSTDFQPYGAEEGQAIHSISRGGLNALLLDAAERAGVTMRFEESLHAVTWQDDVRVVRHEGSGALATGELTTLIGTDGAGSALRDAMKQVPGFTQTIEDLSHGYKELVMPAARGGGFRMEKHALHIWPRTRFMLIALPNLDGSFTCTLFLPYHGAESFAQLASPADVRRFFERWFPDAAAQLSDLEAQFSNNPTGHLSTLRCAPWNAVGKTLLLGDAAHAIVPFYGQGMNCAFEDCGILMDELHAARDFEEAFSRFSRRRKPDADAIATMALENFIEMQAKVEDRQFLLRKEVARRLTQRFPEHFVSQYTLVTFSTVPYRQAMTAGRLQEALLERVCQGIEKPEDIDWRNAERLVRSYAEEMERASR